MSFLIKIFSDLNSVKAQYAPDMDPGTFKKLIEFDPTHVLGSQSAGKYGKWILSLAKKSPFLIPLMTDPGHPMYTKWRDAILKYEKMKRKLPPEYRDVNWFKHPSDLIALVAANASLLYDVKTANEIKRSEAIIPFENDDWVVVQPKTHRAANLWGHGTNWCVAADSETGKSEFRANQTYGPIVYFLSKKDSSLKFVGGGKTYFDFKNRMQDHSPDITPLLDAGFPKEWVPQIAEMYPNYAPVFRL